MGYRHSAAARELTKQKENEVTWNTIAGIFEDMTRDFKSVEIIRQEFPNFRDLLYRSLLSDRSRLNGLSLELLKSCAKVCKKEFNFSQYLPVLMKLSGRANRIFVTRAQEALLVVGMYVDAKSLLKAINENIANVNKNVRVSVYKLVGLCPSEISQHYAGYIERGLKDPATEVREICKGMAVPKLEESVSKAMQGQKKVAIVSNTPRKIPKTTTERQQQEEKIKTLEMEVTKIAEIPGEFRRTNNAFFERLNQLKRDKNTKTGHKDELTPKRLDRYLDRYRELNISNANSQNSISIASNYTGGESTSKAPSNHKIIREDVQCVTNARDDFNGNLVTRTDREPVLENVTSGGEPNIVKMENVDSDEAATLPIEDRAIRKGVAGLTVVVNETTDPVNFEKSDLQPVSSNNYSFMFSPAKDYPRHGFLGETSLFGDEMVSSNSNHNTSFLHVLAEEEVAERAICSTGPVDEEGILQAQNYSLILDGDVDHSDDAINLSQSFANISLEPSRIEEQCNLAGIEWEKGMSTVKYEVALESRNAYAGNIEQKCKQEESSVKNLLNEPILISNVKEECLKVDYVVDEGLKSTEDVVFMKSEETEVSIVELEETKFSTVEEIVEVLENVEPYSGNKDGIEDCFESTEKLHFDPTEAKVDLAGVKDVDLGVKEDGGTFLVEMDSHRHKEYPSILKEPVSTFIDIESFVNDGNASDGIEDILTHVEGREDGPDCTVVLGVCQKENTCGIGEMEAISLSHLSIDNYEIGTCMEAKAEPRDNSQLHEESHMEGDTSNHQSADSKQYHKIFNNELFIDNNPVVPEQFHRPKRPTFCNSAEILEGLQTGNTRVQDSEDFSVGTFVMNGSPCPSDDTSIFNKN